ncbi:MAG: bifunctional DNA-formamidopyrimidine glycosylase/DNA-(apurinic or apyrimidinic site) lyase [Magnetococcales bacterium]|nr:bifunctional DNA-formamidopyrimidine glycosylase/DNA-(apurinic or apyrimidinic site) lyase [Magnetococcales bacterium]
MPELPEVETVCRGLAPLLRGERIVRIEVDNAALRWPVDLSLLQQKLPGAQIQEIARRGKYLLLCLERGTLLIHLGMTGRLYVVDSSQQRLPVKHEHIVVYLASGLLLCYADPRRFGAWVWGGEEPLHHPLLATLGPEPFAEGLNGRSLWQRAQGKRVAVKSWLMDNRVVVGVGNIYAAEALFRAGIHPLTPVTTLAEESCQLLLDHIRAVLAEAIEQGGSTVRNYRQVHGGEGFFQTRLQVYGRQGEGCYRCGTVIRALRIAGRSSCFCPQCQPLHQGAGG